MDEGAGSEVKDMRTIKEIESDLAQTNALINPLRIKQASLSRELQEAKAIKFIEANNIKIEHVESSQGKDKPWFGTVYEFAKWLKEGSKKNWAEWNGRIYLTSDLINGRVPEDMPATIDDLNR